MKLELS